MRQTKQTIKLRESELKRMVAESVKRILNVSSTKYKCLKIW